MTELIKFGDEFMEMIKLSSLSKRFGSVIAVENVDLSIKQGEFVTILGPSGSGKTTLLTLLTGFDDPTTGQIFINNNDVSGLPSEKRNIGLVFQSYALFPHMSVFDNVSFPLKVRRFSKDIIKKRVGEALEKVRLDAYSQRRINELSGGQQQRVALARAFVFEPSILLLDEPMAALDRKLRQELQIELRELQRSLGITTIAVTHDQEEALTMSDRILILNHGRIEQFGTPEELYRKPVNRFVASFLGSGNFFEGKMRIENGNELFICDNGHKIKSINSGLSNNERGCLMIRPEHIQLESMRPNSKGLPGIIRSSIYLGNSTRYHIGIAGNEEVIVIDPSYYIRFKNEEKIVLSWEPEVNWFLPNNNNRDITNQQMHVS